MENPGAYQHCAIEGAPGEGSVPENETVLVLDGQQRLTSCYRAFYGTLDDQLRHPGRFYFRLDAYVDAVRRGEDPDGSGIADFFAFERPARVRKSLDTTGKELALKFFPLDIIFRERRGSSYVRWLGDFAWSEARGDRAAFDTISDVSARFQTAFIERITGYQVNYEKITRDTNPDVICTIFETINTTGVKLTVFDLLVARCFKGGLKLREKLEQALEQFPALARLDPDGSSIAVVQLPRILGLLHKGDCRKGELLQLTAEQVGARWDQAVAGLNKALKLMTGQLGACRLDLIASLDVVAPLAAVCAQPRFSDDRHLVQLRRWYWAVGLSAYFSAAPETKSGRAYREWVDPGGCLDTGAVPEAVADMRLAPTALREAAKQSSLYRGIMALMVARARHYIGAHRREFATLDPDEVEDHHVYPRRFLGAHGIKGAAANAILNRMPVTRETNRRAGADAPDVYFGRPEVVGQGLGPADFDPFGLDRGLLARPFSKDGFEAFLRDREARLRTLVAEAVGRPADEIFV